MRIIRVQTTKYELFVASEEIKDALYASPISRAQCLIRTLLVRAFDLGIQAGLEKAKLVEYSLGVRKDEETLKGGNNG